MATYPGLKPFIVHGHNHQFRDEVVGHLRDTLSMQDPLILDGVASTGRTVIEKFEEESAKCNLAIVLLTPDDEAVSSLGLKYKTARPNVWIELGYFLAQLGRKSGRILLIYREGLDIPTDLSGLIYIDATSGIVNPNVSKRLETELNAIVNSGNFSVSGNSASPSSRNYNVSGVLRLTDR